MPRPVQRPLQTEHGSTPTAEWDPIGKPPPPVEIRVEKAINAADPRNPTAAEDADTAIEADASTMKPPPSSVSASVSNTGSNRSEVRSRAGNGNATALTA